MKDETFFYVSQWVLMALFFSAGCFFLYEYLHAINLSSAEIIIYPFIGSVLFSVIIWNNYPAKQIDECIR